MTVAAAHIGADAAVANAMQVALQAANIDFGTILLPGRIDLDCGSIV